ncbi:MAG: hypothetical protein V5A88_03455 [Candidatus Thermoplasmatota archaeon]
MHKKIKIGLTLVFIGILILSLGYTMLDDFREREEKIERVHPEETILERIDLSPEFLRHSISVGRSYHIDSEHIRYEIER